MRTTLIAAGLVAALLAPTAAGSAIHVRSVGEIFVDAAGHATGLNLAADISESLGVLKGFRAVALDRDVFSQVEIDGFEQAAKIQGVGSSSVVLRGGNADVLLHDNINSVLEVQARAATTIRYHLSDGIRPMMEDGSRAVVHLYAEDEYVGSLVAVGGDGLDARGERLHVLRDEVHARARAGVQVVFVARPVYVVDEAYPKAVVEALAEGLLAASYVTELDGSAVASSHIRFGRAGVETAADSSGVRTTVLGSGRALLVSYDLAYETLPARAASDVSVYIDGKLAQRAASPGEVLSNLRDGLPMYYTSVADGRSQILASTPDFRSSASHTVAIAASAEAPTEAQARAEQRGSNRVVGDFSYSGGGKLLGDFVTALVPDNATSLRSYTSVSSRIEIFRSVSVQADEGATASTDGHRLVIDGAKADITLVDDAYATLLVDAESDADVAFVLGEDVRAQAQSSDVVALEGPDGRLGLLLVVEADGAPRAGSRLSVEPDGGVRARLHEGSRVVFQAASESFASDAAVADAIVNGRVGAQLLAGGKGEAFATAETGFVPGVLADARAEGRRLVVDYETEVGRASSFVLDARGSVLAVKKASDVAVKVNGEDAHAAASPQAVFEPGARARYFAETSANGDLRVLVNAAQAAGERATVVVESRLDEAARAAQGTDAFGAFKVFYDGSAVGNYVRLRADKASGAVTDYGLVADGRAIFASLAVGESAFVTSGLDGATTLVLENREARVEAADSTAGHLKVVAKEATQASFRLAPGLDAVPRSDRVLEIRDATGAHVSSLVATGGTFDLEGDAVRATLQEGAHVLHRAHVGLESELSDAQRAMVNEAIASGRVLGHVMLRAPAFADELPLQATSGAAVDAVVSQFSDVEMVTAATRDRIDVVLSSESPMGRTLMLTLDPDTLPGLAEGRALVLFDGVPVGEADSFADVLDATDDGGVAEYLVLAGESGTQVLVSVPNFSVHTVTLKEAPRDDAHSPWLYATLALGALVLVQGAAMIALRRRKA